MTLEEAQAQILEQQERITALENERDTLSQNNATLSADLERVRTLNQQYFNKLTAFYSPQQDKITDGEKEVQTCEEFAKTLNI